MINQEILIYKYYHSTKIIKTGKKNNKYEKYFNNNHNNIDNSKSDISY